MLSFIDVCGDYQPKIDFSGLVKAGISGVFLKADQGTAMIDPKVGRWRGLAVATGLLLGTYHFPTYRVDSTNEVQHYLNAVLPLNEGENIMFDLEGRAVQNNLPFAVQFARNWCDAITEKTGVIPWIYGSYSTLANSKVAAAFSGKNPIWVARYKSPVVREVIQVPGYPQTGMDQYSQTGQLPGETGTFDLDVFDGTPDDFRNQGYHQR
jgi:GH25 family lysozyme M1 (1,4-beta-N-acetylmuramidase)